jgi:hypothetical protein
VILGDVATRTSQPVAGARILAAMFLNECGSFVSAESYSEAHSASNGSFSFRVGTLQPESVCVTLRVTPPIGSALIEKTITDLKMHIDLPPQAIDTTRVTIVLDHQ